jgi:hypothetical protein
MASGVSSKEVSNLKSGTNPLNRRGINNDVADKLRRVHTPHTMNDHVGAKPEGELSIG